MKFLQRAIKEDRKGPYVNYGPMRFRPSEPRITKFCLDEKVAVNLRFYYTDRGVEVFKDADYYEIWKSIARKH